MNMRVNPLKLPKMPKNHTLVRLCAGIGFGKYVSEKIIINLWEGKMKASENNIPVNPLADIINDKLFVELIRRGVVNEKYVRDYYLRSRFKEMREHRIGANEAIEKLNEEYPYLQFDTIRKIVYRPVY